MQREMSGKFGSFVEERVEGGVVVGEMLGKYEKM
jgi:hypothetical protein